MEEPFELADLLGAGRRLAGQDAQTLRRLLTVADVLLRHLRLRPLVTRSRNRCCFVFFLLLVELRSIDQPPRRWHRSSPIAGASVAVVAESILLLSQIDRKSIDLLVTIIGQSSLIAIRLQIERIGWTAIICGRHEQLGKTQ